jgi:hypothetical protein
MYVPDRNGRLDLRAETKSSPAGSMYNQRLRALYRSIGRLSRRDADSHNDEQP